MISQFLLDTRAAVDWWCLHNKIFICVLFLMCFDFWAKCICTCECGTVSAEPLVLLIKLSVIASLFFYLVRKWKYFGVCSIWWLVLHRRWSFLSFISALYVYCLVLSVHRTLFLTPCYAFVIVGICSTQSQVASSYSFILVILVIVFCLLKWTLKMVVLVFGSFSYCLFRLIHFKH